MKVLSPGGVPGADPKAREACQGGEPPRLTAASVAEVRLHSGPGATRARLCIRHVVGRKDGRCHRVDRAAVRRTVSRQ